MASVKPNRPSVDPELHRAQVLRACLGRFATGVCIVSFDGPDGRHGLTINSFTSVSMSPPLVLVSVARDARGHDAIAGRPFCVNVLGAEQEALARCFAGGPPLEPAWLDGAHAPRLAGVLAHLECAPWAAHEAGDHTLFVGQVADFGFRDGDALGYLTSRFTTFPEPELGSEYLI